MLQQTNRLLFDQLIDHVGEDGANRVKALVRLANVRKSQVIQQNLLDNENSHRLAQLRAGLHYAKAQGYDFGREEEVDDVGRVILDERANDTERGQAEVFERARLGGSVQKWVKKQWNMRCA